MIVAGQPAKRLLWALREQWPADRFAKKSADKLWVADINVGSISCAAFDKKDGNVGAVLKARLLNIRALKIGDKLVAGERWQEELPEATYCAVAYVNDANFDKSFLKISVLDGKIEDPNYQSLNVNFDAQAFPIFCRNAIFSLNAKRH